MTYHTGLQRVDVMTCSAASQFLLQPKLRDKRTLKGLTTMPTEGVLLEINRMHGGQLPRVGIQASKRIQVGVQRRHLHPRPIAQGLRTGTAPLDLSNCRLAAKLSVVCEAPRRTDLLLGLGTCS